MTFSAWRNAASAWVNISAAFLIGIPTIIAAYEFRRRLSAVISLSALSRI
jgi:hypothetical protein